VTRYSPTAVAEAEYLRPIELDGVVLPFGSLDHLHHDHVVTCCESALRLVEARHPEAATVCVMVLEAVLHAGHALVPRLSAQNRRLLEQLAPGYVEHVRDVLLFRLDARAHGDVRFKTNGRSGRRWRVEGATGAGG
jgi:hypothetical protein